MFTFVKSIYHRMSTFVQNAGAGFVFLDARFRMTFPRAEREELMITASWNRRPSLCDRAKRSEPARSQKFSTPESTCF